MVTPTKPSGRRTALTALLATALATAPLALAAAPAHAATTGLVRIDQTGFLAGETKQAYLMTSAAVSSASYSVVDSTGATVKTGTVGTTSLGSWNTAYPAVYPITIGGLTTPGTYHVVVTGGVSASSPNFKVTDAAGLYGKFVADGLTFVQGQRDGGSVIAGPLGRKPAHLNDATANVYATPSFQSGGSDVITNSDLSKVGGPVNVAGGWSDAGDYLKFTHTTAYGDAVLFAAQRALGAAAPAGLNAEAHFGADWLNKMWDQSTKTLYLQVGVGSGNASGSFVGDHDLWRLPEKDDGDTATADRYAAAHRPVFRAANPGAQISPNLAGRVSAAFALAAQVDATANPTQAQAYYQAATSLYAMANTSAPPSTLTTAVPNDYYPESTWRDDMEFGGAELALAAQALGQNATPYLTAAAGYAKGYIATDTGDTFNLYDTSALGHADLIQAIKNAGNPGGLAVTTADLVNDLKRQTKVGADHAASDMFHAGANYADFDVDSHSFGLLAVEALYKQASGDGSYDGYATQQRNWLMGANPWGTSFMVGEGTTFPHCIQHQIANINGSTDGTGAIPVGAVVNGPNASSIFSGGLGSYQTGMKACPPGGADPFNAYTGHSSRYVDDVRSWQTSEPALDMTGSAIIGAALQQAANGTTTPPADDFSLSLSPASGSVQQGGTATAALTTAVTTGNPQQLTLTTSGAPSSVAVSLNPATVTAGSGSTLTATVNATTAPGSYPITVTATGPTGGTHTAVYTLTVTSSGGGTCTATQLLTNPGFENTTPTWTQTSTLGFQPITTATTAEPAHTGSKIAWFNGNSTADTDTIAQTATLPAGCTTTLTYWLHVDTTENTTTATPDTLKAQLLDTNGTVITTLATHTNLDKATGYTKHTADLTPYAGRTVTLKFTGTETDTNGGTTNFTLDDTTLDVAASTAPADDFSLALAPANGTVTAGQSATATVSTAVASGAAQTVALTASGLPGGASAAFSPASVTAGGGSTLTVTTAASTPAGTYPITVTGTGASATHTATYTLTVTGSGPSGGSFEAEAAGNTRTGRATVVACVPCSGGNRDGYLGTVTAGTGALTFNGVTVATAGSYQVQVAYTNGSASARNADISVNGGAAQTVSFAPTGAFTTVGTVTVTLTLTAGTNTVTFANPSGAAPDLDRLVVPGTPG
ncbi:glycoside hydrolase family 9 protein [Kitasatospora sp. NPDC049285]|uniref:glycoside hydrolase family 9 protein n=1 Tax=Kitasatospora sp. NPDC049285 TaxID=3157096 RepID=UPI0034128B6B